MRFTKMHGIGNDYVYVNGFEETVKDPAVLARRVSDRHFGIGGDGLILIERSDEADVRMRMFNADGSEAQMCGNGVRCVAKYAFDHGLTASNPMKVQTGRGVLTLELYLQAGKVAAVRVNMGRPILEAAAIPVRIAGLGDGARVVDYSVEKALAESMGEELEHMRSELGMRQMTCVSMGNPHLVIYCDADAVPLEKYGPILERHRAFPQRINVHVVNVLSAQEVRMRTWERGSGITLACGTGACAVCVAGVLTGRGGRTITAHLPGGDLLLEWRQADDCVYMTGPATEVFSGEYAEE